MQGDIIQGDALAVLKTLPSNHVQCIVTSPPYYGLRDYGCDGQIGLEETPEQYVEKLTAVFREVRRVLREDGTCWINLGDSYASSSKGSGGDGTSSGLRRDGRPEASRIHSAELSLSHQHFEPRKIDTGLPAKNLIGIPWRVAFALQADGWILRQDIIWEKPNSMPESVKDRCTKSHEYVFLLAKSERYFYDAEAIKEPVQDIARMLSLTNRTSNNSQGNGEKGKSVRFGSMPDGRNKRSVWSIPTKPYKDAHFAVMSPDLAELCILAGSSDKACEHCGKAWERVTEHTPMVISHGPKAGSYGSRTTDGLSGTMVSPAQTRTVGFQPACSCANNTGSAKSIVLDPFSGAATTAYVASKLGRQYIGIELNPEYVALSQKRLGNLTAGLWGFDEEIA